MLRVDFKPSAWLAALLTCAHGASAAVVIPLEAPIWVKLSIVCLIVVGLARAIYRYVLLRGRSTPTAVELRVGGVVSVKLRGGSWLDAQILGTTYVSPMLMLINLKLAQRWLPCHIVLMPDSAAADDLRRLRVLLRWGCSGRTGSSRFSDSGPAIVRAGRSP